MDRWERIKSWETTSPEDTMEVGSWLAKVLKAGDTVALAGQLGAGKTTLVRGLVRGLGFNGRVRSPSFTLMNEYPTTPRVRHADLYRLGDTSELIGLGFDDEDDSDAILLVEWADRFEEEWGLPTHRVTLVVTGDEGEGREIHLDKRA